MIKIVDNLFLIVITFLLIYKLYLDYRKSETIDIKAFTTLVFNSKFAGNVLELSKIVINDEKIIKDGE